MIFKYGMRIETNETKHVDTYDMDKYQFSYVSGM